MTKKKYEHKIKITGTSKHAYDFYKEKYGRNGLPVNTFTKVCRRLNEIISDKIVEETFEFKMPHKLGFIRIKRAGHDVLPTNKEGGLHKGLMIVDWKETWNYWYEKYPDKTRAEIMAIKGKKPIYQTNPHTDGAIMKWYWFKQYCNIPNHSYYRFKPVKGNRLKLGKWILNPERTNDYFN